MTETADEFKFFLPLSKVKKEEDGSRTVSGYATTETLDLDGEIVTMKAVKNALPAYMKWRNIRQMHQPIAVGVAKEAEFDDDGLFLTSKIIDANCIKLLDGDVLKGYSIGGRKLAKVGNKITEIELVEISLVDRPANPDCRIEVRKVAKKSVVFDGESEGEDEPKVPEFLLRAAEADALKPEEMGVLRKLIAFFSKSAEPEIKEPTDAEWFEDEIDKAQSVADLEYVLMAAPASVIGKLAGDKLLLKVFTQWPTFEKREFSQKERESSAASGAALPDGSFPIKSKKDVANAVLAHGRAKDKAKAKAHIVARAKLVPGGEAELPEDWKPKGKTAGADIIDLNKNMSAVRCLADAFDCVQNAKRKLLIEGNVEGDTQDGELATRLAAIGKDLAEIIGQSAEHEGEEAITLEDADDMWLSYILKTSPGANKMTKAAETLTAEQKVEFAKRAASMHKQAVMKAKGHLDKALVHQAHGMAALAKCAGLMSMAKKGADGLKPDELSASLTKAQQHFDAMSDLQEVAAYNLNKAASSWGTGNGLPSTPSGSISEVSQGEMTEGEVPEYEAGEVYDGKGAGMSIEALTAIVATAVKAATGDKTEDKQLAEIKELLSKMPGGQPRARLFSVDKSFFAGDAGTADDKKSPMSKMMDGVVPFDQNDPDQRQAAAARVIGNMIKTTFNGDDTFGKSPFHDPNFRGGATRNAA